MCEITMPKMWQACIEKGQVAAKAVFTDQNPFSSILPAIILYLTFLFFLVHVFQFLLTVILPLI